MAMSEDKNPPLSEEVEFDAVDLEKQPKRVRKAEAKPPTRKKSTPAKKTFSKVEKNIARGTKKKLLPLPFEVAKKKPFKGRKMVKPDFKGIEKKDPRKRNFSRKPTFNPEMTEKACSGKEGPFLLQVFQAATIDPNFTQGFHHYPGRIPLQMAKLLLEHFGQKGRLFDPFMGSGTILLEGLLAGMKVAGNDLNPIASVITRERCRWLSLRNARRVWTEVEELRQGIEKENLGKHRVHHLHAESLQNLYPPHLLVEMLHWMERINQLPDPAVRESLRAVFSSLIYRFTPEEDAVRRQSRVGRGQFGRAMGERTKELIEAQTELSDHIRLIENPQLSQEDILKLEHDPPLEADLILTRPPFPGNGKQMLSQKLLLKWLNLPIKPFEEGQLGIGTDFQKKNWTPRFRKLMLNLRRASVSGGRCIMLFEDWLDRGKKVDALNFVRRFSGSEGWKMTASASRPLQHYSRGEEDFGRNGKQEHLVLLRC